LLNLLLNLVKLSCHSATSRDHNWKSKYNTDATSQQINLKLCY